jgi:hypothetical protein
MRSAQASLTVLLFSRTQHCVAPQHDDRNLIAAYLTERGNASLPYDRD